VPAAFGPRAGPLVPFAKFPTAVAVAGRYVLSFESTRGGGRRLMARDVTGSSGSPRELALPAGAVDILDASGDYVAFFVGAVPNASIVVLDVRTGAEVYRVPALVIGWGLGPDGRVVLLQRRANRVRVVTATPANPTLRAITTTRLAAPRVSVAPAGILLARTAPGELGELVFVGYDGTTRALTPALNGIREFDFDGRQLAFTAGRCVFAGDLPTGTPGPAPRDRCFNLPAQLDFAFLDRKAQSSGAALQVRLTCTAPPHARCPARLRLRGPSFTVRRAVKIVPGGQVISIAIPRQHRDAAWQTGMTLETRENGRSSSGTVIPS
jgi:hypothetical protein